MTGDRRDFDASEFLANLRILEGHVAGASRQGLLEAGEYVLGEAQKLCPVATGTLVGSATTDDSHADQGEVVIGFNTDYAAAVHERTDVPHGQGQAKFLEDAMKTHLPRVNEIIGQRIEREGLRD
ncbi:MAG TPA: hypothetical protein VMW52_10590 [Phycisphaerae bacterium]|nr:hypothetical protein [Phycisphaerae bacterium]